MDKTCVGEIRFLVAIFSKNTLNRRSGLGELDWDLKRTNRHVPQNGFWRPMKAARQVTSVCDDRFASY